MLVAPFFAAGAAASFLVGPLGAAAALAVIFASFTIAWVAALAVAETGRDEVAGAAALLAGVAAAAMLVAAAGGAASPICAMALALPLEAAWLRRTVRAALWGAAAAFAVFPLQYAFGHLLGPVAPVTGWQWFLPLAYAATLVPRAAGLVREERLDRGRPGKPLLEDIIDAVVMRIAPSGEVVDVGAKAQTILNLAPELLLATGLFDRIHVADRVAYLCAIANMREGAANRRLDVRVRLPRADDGTNGDNYRNFALELLGDQGNGAPFTAIFRDNEEVASLRASLAAAADTADSSDIAKARFLATVSHELRTPLNAIIGFSDMLMHEMFGGFSDPRQKEYVGLVSEAGHHLLAVVNSILDVSKIESGAYTTNPEPFRFRDAVDMCRSMMCLQADAKGIALDVRVPAGTGEIRADRRAVQQMLINLISNAIKFTPQGGQVAIGAKRIGSRLHFWISDNGIGIAEDDLSRLGKPFVQVKNDYTRQFEGTGLGLSLVKGLVALHGGAMSIESAPGEGTTVSISLPVDGPRHEAGEGKREVLPMPTGKMKEDANGSLRKAG
jgi:cell cycle sensor histidine kinase DivJ